MTVKELWNVSPQCFVFVKSADGKVKEYEGNADENGAKEVKDILATRYPMYKNVLEVKLAE